MVFSGTQVALHLQPTDFWTLITNNALFGTNIAISIENDYLYPTL